MNFTYIVGTSFTKLRLLSHTLSFTVDTIFSSLRETLCADRVKLFAEASERYTHAVLPLSVVGKTASSECILQGAKKGPRLLNRNCTEVEALINLPLWLNPSNCLI
jgi:hypothetical protein